MRLLDVCCTFSIHERGAYLCKIHLALRIQLKKKNNKKSPCQIVHSCMSCTTKRESVIFEVHWSIYGTVMPALETYTINQMRFSRGFSLHLCFTADGTYHLIWLERNSGGTEKKDITEHWNAIYPLERLAPSCGSAVNSLRANPIKMVVERQVQSFST